MLHSLKYGTRHLFLMGAFCVGVRLSEKPNWLYIVFRYHAIFQFGTPNPEDQNVEFQKDGSAGFYLFELGSTHGTFLNKAKVPQGKYYRIKVGHMVKFGNSTRTYILQVSHAATVCMLLAVWATLFSQLYYIPRWANCGSRKCFLWLIYMNKKRICISIYTNEHLGEINCMNHSTANGQLKT